MQEEAVERARTRTTGSISLSPLGQPATERSAGVTGSSEPNDCPIDTGDRAGSGEIPTGGALDDPSRGGCTDGVSLRADYRGSRTLSVRQTSGVLFGIGTLGGLERRQASAGTYHKQGNTLLRFLLVEAAQVSSRTIPEWRSKYIHLTMRRGRKIAKVAMARKLAMRLFWMMRQGWNYQQVVKFGSHVEQPGNRHGVQSNTE